MELRWACMIPCKCAYYLIQIPAGALALHTESGDVSTACRFRQRSAAPRRCMLDATIEAEPVPSYESDSNH